ncbi:hypothetical protein ACT43G_06070 [Acinetobacter baumannii]|nr:hypothetical protein [Acinetobacter baumannii]MDC5239952.1 hypothetical protein [Acinetobacter baumannii]
MGTEKVLRDTVAMGADNLMMADGINIARNKASPTPQMRKPNQNIAYILSVVLLIFSSQLNNLKLCMNHQSFVDNLFLHYRFFTKS